MNRSLLAGLLSLLLGAAAASAQDPKPADTIPAPSNNRGAAYPRIHPDLRVTFRIKAPDAKKVEFKFVGGTAYPADRGEDGFWTATTKPQVPENGPQRRHGGRRRLQQESASPLAGHRHRRGENVHRHQELSRSAGESRHQARVLRIARHAPRNG
jgi:hypothetical protein